MRYELELPESTFLVNNAIYYGWAEGGRDVSDPMLKIEKCCEGVRDPSRPEKSEI